MIDEPLALMHTHHVDIISHHFFLHVLFAPWEIVHRLTLLVVHRLTLLIVIAHRHFVALKLVVLSLLRRVREDLQGFLPLSFHDRMKVFGDVVPADLILAELRLECVDGSSGVEQLNLVQLNFFWTLAADEIDFFFVPKIIKSIKSNLIRLRASLTS